MPDSLPGMRWDVDVDPAPPAPSDRQLVVIMTPEAAASLDADATGANVPELSAVLAENQLQLEPLFSGLAARADLSAAAADQDAPDLSVFYQVQVGQDRLDEVAAQLRQLPQVDAAYVKPGDEPASLASAGMSLSCRPAVTSAGGRGTSMPRRRASALRGRGRRPGVMAAVFESSMWKGRGTLPTKISPRMLMVCWLARRRTTSAGATMGPR